MTHDPDPVAIASFLQMIVDNWPELPEPTEIVVELSAIAPGGGRRQRSFSLEEGWTHVAAEWAHARNVEGANLYWIPQPKSKLAANRVAKDTDIVALCTVFVDQDDPDSTPIECLPIVPSVVVTTGLIPHERRHVYYALSSAQTDPEKWRQIQRSLIRFAKGDPACVNPARLMRLPGTVSHPSSQKRDRGHVPEYVSWSMTSYDRLSFTDLENVFAAGEDGPQAEITEPTRASPAREGTRTKARELGLDRRVIELLRGRRNTLPKGSYKVWRDIAFGTIDKYRGTSLEAEAQQAFFDFSERWEHGNTDPRDTVRLWKSDDDTKEKRIGPGTAIRHLQSLPIIGPASNREPETDSIEKAPLPRFSGLAGHLQNLLDEASDRMPGELSIGGVLAALSALLGPSAVITNGIQGRCCTNLYVLALATTAQGKETIRTLAASLLREAGRGAEVLDGSPSDVSFQSTLARQGGRATLMIDEAGILAKAMKSQSLGWQRLLMSLLMQIYGRGLTRLEARRYRDAKNDIDAVEFPRPTLMLTSTIEDFVPGTSQEDSSSGFFNRMTTFVDPVLPPLKARGQRSRRSAVTDLPDDVKRAIGRLPILDHGIHIPKAMKEITIEMTGAAIDAIETYKYDVVEVRIRSGTLQAQTWGRAIENVQRVAGLLAVSDALVEGDGTILGASCDRHHVDQAIAIVTRGLQRLESIASEAGRRPNELVRLKDKVVAFLERSGGRCMQNDITRHPLRGMDIERRNRLLDAMVEDGEIKVMEEDAVGKPGPKPKIYCLPRNTSQALSQ